MADNAHNLKLDILPEQIRQPLTLFAERLRADLGDNLQSITVVGSSLTRDYRAGRSDINTVLVLDRFSLDCLNTIAGMAKPMSKKKVSVPLLMTPAYIERSLDVFGVEFLDFQLTHRTILGSDPFVQLRFEKRNVRLQCERELKATLIRLRQGYIAAAAKKKMVRDIIIAAAKGLAPLLRAMLWLRDIDRPAETEATFNKAAAEFSVRTESLITAGNWRYEKGRLQDKEMTAGFESIYKTVERLAGIVDEIHWEPQFLPPPLTKQNAHDEESLQKPDVPALRAASKDKLLADEVVLYEESIPTVGATKQGDLPVRWLNFYTNVRIPLGIFYSLLSFGISLPVLAEEPAVLVFTSVLTAILIGLSIFLFIGLHRRRVWGWRLNWVVLVLEVFLRPLDRAEDVVMYIVFLMAALLLWLLPNAIYFKKRRHLFT